MSMIACLTEERSQAVLNVSEFHQRQECGTTETVSEAPGAYGIRSCSHTALIASYETTSALSTLPGPEVGMALWYTASGHHPAVLPLPQPLDGPGAPRTSVPAYCCHNRCLQHGLGRYMQRAGSLGALDRAPTALAHQLPRAVSLIAQTLCKLREDEQHVLLVAPHWPTWTWYPELISLATAPSWRIPLRKDILSQGLGTKCPDLWNLHVWLLDGTWQT